MRLALFAALLVASSAAAQPSCQATQPGVNSFTGVLHEFRSSEPRRAGEPPTHFVLRLETPLCAHDQAMPVSGRYAEALQDRMLELAIPGGDPRPYVGKRVVVSGTLLERRPDRPQAVLQVGSLTPLPMVAGDRT